MIDFSIEHPLQAFLAFLLQHPYFTGVMTEIHWHSTGNFDEDLKAYFGHLHDNNSWYKHKVQKNLGKKGMDLFPSFKIIELLKTFSWVRCTVPLLVYRELYNRLKPSTL